VEGASFQPGTPSSTCLYFNARSLLPKFDELAATIDALQPTVICIVESWLSEEISDSEISLEGYTIYRLDRNRHGGGVMMYVKSCVTSELLLMGSPNLEFLSISIFSPLSNCKHCISLFYRPPSSPADIFDNLFTVVHKLNPFCYSNFVLIGDFNVDFLNQSHPLSSKLQGFLYSFSLSQVVNSSTHSKPNGEPSLIDLALLLDTSQLINCCTVPPLANSDHNGLQLLLKWKPTV